NSATAVVVDASDPTAAQATADVIATVTAPFVVPYRGKVMAGSSSTSIKLDTGASALSNTYLGDSIVITGGTGVGQSRTITAYNGSTKLATVDTAWTTIPDNTSTFEIDPVTVFSGRALAGSSSTTIKLDGSASPINNYYSGDY